jgi:cytoskeletal protein CcmA (bactofilin family)
MAQKHTDYPESVIGQSVKVEGDLNSEGDLQIEGSVVGRVNTLRNLFVGETARIQADVTAQNATIAGIVEGDIKVNDTIVILETGKVLGNVFCKRFGIKEGAYFAGQSNMERDGAVEELVDDSKEE